jgi:ABC-type Zn uptake system ZnuABC Zn-binding protein ZnuA
MDCFTRVENFIAEKSKKNMQEVETLEKVLKGTIKLISAFNNMSSQKRIDFLENEKLRGYFNRLFKYDPNLIAQLHPKAGYSEQKCKDIANAIKEENVDALPSALYLFDASEFPRVIDILNNQKELLPNKMSQKTSEISHEADNMTDFSRMATKALEKEDRFKECMVRNQRV